MRFLHVTRTQCFLQEYGSLSTLAKYSTAISFAPPFASCLTIVVSLLLVSAVAKLCDVRSIRPKKPSGSAAALVTVVALALMHTQNAGQISASRALQSWISAQGGGSAAYERQSSRMLGQKRGPGFGLVSGLEGLSSITKAFSAHSPTPGLLFAGAESVLAAGYANMPRSDSEPNTEDILSIDTDPSEELSGLLKKLSGLMKAQHAPRTASWQGLPAKSSWNWFDFDAQVQDTLSQVGASSAQIAAELDSCTDHDEWTHSLQLVEELMKHPRRGLSHRAGVHAIPKHVEESLLAGVQSASRLLSKEDVANSRPFQGESAARLMGGLEGKRGQSTMAPLPHFEATPPAPDPATKPSFSVDSAANAFVETTGDNVIRPAESTQAPGPGKWLSTALASMLGMSTATAKPSPGSSGSSSSSDGVESEDMSWAYWLQVVAALCAIGLILLVSSIRYLGKGTLELLFGRVPSTPQDATSHSNVHKSIDAGPHVSLTGAPARKGKGKKGKGGKKSSGQVASAAKSGVPSPTKGAPSEAFSQEQSNDLNEDAGPQTILSMFGALLSDSPPGAKRSPQRDQATAAAPTTAPLDSSSIETQVNAATPASSEPSLAGSPDKPSPLPPSQGTLAQAAGVRDLSKDSAATKKRRKRGGRRSGRNRGASFASTSSAGSSVSFDKSGLPVDGSADLAGQGSTTDDGGWKRAGANRSHSRSVDNDSDDDAFDSTRAFSLGAADDTSELQKHKQEPGAVAQGAQQAPHKDASAVDKRPQVDVQQASNTDPSPASDVENSPVILSAGADLSTPSQATEKSAKSTQAAEQNGTDTSADQKHAAVATSAGASPSSKRSLKSWEEIQAQRRAVEAEQRAKQQKANAAAAQKAEAQAAAARRTAHLKGLVSKQRESELRGWLAVHSAAGDSSASTALQLLEDGASLREALLGAHLLSSSDLPPAREPPAESAAETDARPTSDSAHSTGESEVAAEPAAAAEETPVTEISRQVYTPPDGTGATVYVPDVGAGLSISTPAPRSADDIKTPMSLRLPAGLDNLNTPKVSEPQDSMPKAIPMGALSPMSDSGSVGGVPIHMGQAVETQPPPGVSASPDGALTGLNVFNSIPLDGYSIFGNGTSTGGLAPGLSAGLDSTPPGALTGMGLGTSTSLVPGDMGGLQDSWGGGTGFDGGGGSAMSNGGLGLGGLGGFSSLLGMPLGGGDGMSQGLPLTSLGQQGGLGVVGAPLSSMAGGLDTMGAGAFEAPRETSQGTEKREDDILAGSLDFLDS